MSTIDYDELQALVEAYQNGDTAAYDPLLRMGKTLARVIVRENGYFLPHGWGDENDLVQNGLLGFAEAVRDWRPGEGRFGAFADLCINRKVITAVKAATRVKHRLQNDADRLERPLRHHKDRGKLPLTLADVLPDQLTMTPLEAAMRREEAAEAAWLLGQLQVGMSERETRTMALYFVQGLSYAEIGALTGDHFKCVDNTLQRIRKKLRRRVAAIAADESLPEDVRQRCKAMAQGDAMRGVAMRRAARGAA